MLWSGGGVGRVVEAEAREAREKMGRSVVRSGIMRCSISGFTGR
jgi:hypothetical protein